MSTGRIKVVVCISILALMIGCSGGNSSTSATGTWNFMTPLLAIQETALYLTQSGGAVTGNTAKGGTVSGTADGDHYALDITYADGYQISLDANIDDDTITCQATDSEGGSATATATKQGDDDGDDDSDDDGADSVSELVGTWTTTMGAKDPGDPDIVVVLTIRADNTYSTQEEGESENGTWSVDGNQITLSTVAEGTIAFTLDGNTLTFTFPPDEDDEEDELNVMVWTRG